MKIVQLEKYLLANILFDDLHAVLSTMKMTGLQAVMFMLVVCNFLATKTLISGSYSRVSNLYTTNSMIHM